MKVMQNLNLKGKRILIVEDDYASVYLMKDFFMILLLKYTTL
jgi:hypothetical protein